MQAALAGARLAKCSSKGRRACRRVRRFGMIADRRDVVSCGAGDNWRQDRAFRHAGRSRQSVVDRQCRRPSGTRRARLCTRSPKENGFDWVLMRLLAGFAGAARGHHRHGRRWLADGDRDAAAAAWTATSRCIRPAISPLWCSPPAASLSRMGGPNKLLAEIGGRPLVRIVTEQVLASRARPVIVVTGHQGERVEAALAGPAGRVRAQSGFRRRLRHLAQSRHRRAAGAVGRRSLSA